MGTQKRQNYVKNMFVAAHPAQFSGRQRDLVPCNVTKSTGHTLHCRTIIFLVLKIPQQNDSLFIGLDTTFCQPKSLSAFCCDLQYCSKVENLAAQTTSHDHVSPETPPHAPFLEALSVTFMQSDFEGAVRIERVESEKRVPASRRKYTQ